MLTEDKLNEKIASAKDAKAEYLGIFIDVSRDFRPKFRFANNDTHLRGIIKEEKELANQVEVIFDLNSNYLIEEKDSYLELYRKANKVRKA